MKMFMNRLVVCVILVVLQTSVMASEVSEEVQLLQQQVLGMQRQMDTMQQVAAEKQDLQQEKNDDVQILKKQLQKIQQQMATEREEMQQQMATEREEMQHQMATEREEMHQQMATEREEMQHQITTEKEEIQQQMETEREIMQHQITTERQERQEEMEKMQVQIEKLQQQMATERESLKHETTERQEMQLTMRKQNNTLKQNINNINAKLTNVVHENQLLGEIVSVLKQNVSLGFENVSVMVSQAVGGKHNGSFIGFSAYPSERRDYTEGLTVLFDSVITNVGSMYTPATSIFICGYEGYYLFSVSVHAGTGDVMFAELVMGDNNIAYVYADRTDPDSGSNTVVVLCPLFSSVFVRTMNDGLTLSWGPYSMFTGILLHKQQ